jgi:mRNA interferase MazF
LSKPPYKINIEKEIEKELDNQLKTLKTAILAMPDEKKQKIITKWIKQWAAYIDFEPKFKPEYNIKYDPGTIVQVNFGYNVGSEQGGARPAVVIEDNNRSSKVVVVIPLSSLKKDKTIEEIESKGNVYLGILEEYNKVFRQKEGTESIALMNQIKSISKMRISTPTKKRDKVLSLDPSRMEKIYDALHERFSMEVIKVEKFEQTNK